MTLQMFELLNKIKIIIIIIITPILHDILEELLRIKENEGTTGINIERGNFAIDYIYIYM